MLGIRSATSNLVDGFKRHLCARRSCFAPNDLTYGMTRSGHGIHAKRGCNKTNKKERRLYNLNLLKLGDTSTETIHWPSKPTHTTRPSVLSHIPSTALYTAVTPRAAFAANHGMSRVGSAVVPTHCVR